MITRKRKRDEMLEDVEFESLAVKASKRMAKTESNPLVQIEYLSKFIP